MQTFRAVQYPLTLLILSLVVSVIFSLEKMASVRELYKYISGILLFCAGISLRMGEKEKIIRCLLLSALIISLFATYQYFFGFTHLLEYISRQNIHQTYFLSDYITRRRVFFPFITPSILGGYLALLLPLCFFQKDRLWLIPPLSFALLLTKPLGALISVLSGVVVYFSLQGKLNKRKMWLLFGLLVAVLLLGVIRSIDQDEHSWPSFSTSMRLEYWKGAWEIIKGFPLTGVGLGNFNLQKARYAHNSYLQIWAEAGILGIISMLWLLLTAGKTALRAIATSPNKNQTIGLVSACAVFLVHNIVDFSFFLPEVALIWWLLLGLTQNSSVNTPT